MSEELERERMRLAVCGVVALANTRESAAHVRECNPDYWSDSAQNVALAVDREIAGRERIAELEARLAAVQKDRDIEKAEREAAWNRMKAAQDKLAAAEKRATEAEAKCAVLIDRLDVTNRGLRFSLDTFHPDDRARYKSVIEKNEAALKNPPARAQAVADVLNVFPSLLRDAPIVSTIDGHSACGYCRGRACLGRIEHRDTCPVALGKAANAKLAALDKEPTT